MIIGSEKMDVLILCGGYATRLEPITLFIPKPLLAIGGKPIIDNIVDDIKDCKEVNRIIISTNKKFEAQFRYWMDNKRASGFPKQLEIIVEPTTEHKEKLGAIRGIEYAIGKAGISDDMMIVAGDNFYKWSLRNMIYEFINSGRKATVCVHDVGSVEDAKKFGIVQLQGKRIVKFEEKPENPSSTMASTGIYLYPKDMIPKFSEYLSGDNNPDAPGHFLHWLVNSTEIEAVINDGEWFDIGTLETYHKVYSQFNGC